MYKRSIDILKSVIEEYPNRKNSIEIIHHKENKGLPQARRTGYLYAKGKYIAHCDSDDWPAFNMYEKLYNKAVEDDLDMVRCLHYVTNDNGIEVLQRPAYNGNDAYKAMSELIAVKGWNPIWNKMFKRCLYSEDILLPQANMLEDFVLVLQLLMRSQKIGNIDEPLYYYYINPNSICNYKQEGTDVQNALNAKKNVDLMIEILESASLLQKFQKEVVVLKYCAKWKLIPSFYSYAKYKYWKVIYPEIDLKVLVSNFIDIRSKIQYLMIMFRIYPVYQSLKKRFHV